MCEIQFCEIVPEPGAPLTPIDRGTRFFRQGTWCIFNKFYGPRSEIQIARSHAVPTARAPHFPHRHNKDGMWESICSECFLAVAKESLEDELEVHERANVCKGLDLIAVYSAYQITAGSGCLERINVPHLSPPRDLSVARSYASRRRKRSSFSRAGQFEHPMQQTSRTATPTVTRMASSVLFVVIQCKNSCILVHHTQLRHAVQQHLALEFFYVCECRAVLRIAEGTAL